MAVFTRINKNVYRINTPDENGSVIFIADKNNFLINCGASEKAVDYAIVPALKKMGYSLRSIHGVVFTECSEYTAGGAHRLQSIAPGARFFGFGCQADRLKNPTYYELNTFSSCLDYAPPMREIRGIFVDGDVDVHSRMFESLLPVPTPGHGEDSVCWYHVGTKTLICGDSLQGNGSVRSGCPIIINSVKYRESLSAISELDIECLVCAEGIFEVPSVTQGSAQCLDVISQCLEFEDDCQNFALEYLNAKRSAQLAVTLEDITAAYFAERGFKPAFSGYAMLTFHGYLKRFS